ncbi:MAG TPA: PAS domain S-box protein [Rhodospirillales bacterium]|nr:PAS domain S-box protein [Rhodospirillales bacterium]
MAKSRRYSTGATAARSVREIEARWRSLVQKAPEAIIILQGLRIRFANRQAVRMFGARSAAELLGQRIERLIHPEDLPRAIERVRRVLRTGRSPRYMDLRYRRLDGSIFVGCGRPVRIVEQGRPAILGIIRDVTAQYEAFAALERSEARLRDFAELASDWFWETDADLRYTWFSENVTAIAGLSRDWYRGRSRFDVLRAGMDPAQLEEHRRLVEKRLPYRDLDLCLVGPDGSHYWVRSNGKPVFDEKGKFLGYRGTGRDVTALKQAELASRREKERYRKLAEMLPDAVVVHVRGRVCFANPAMAELVGAADPAELVGRHVLDFVHPEDHEVARAHAREIAETGRGTAKYIRVLRPDGSVRSVESRAALLDCGGEQAILVVGIDVTDLQRSRAEKERSDRRYRQLVDLSPDAVLLHRDGRILFANRQAAALFGFASPEEMIGRDGLAFVDPRDRRLVTERWERLAQGEEVGAIEVRLRRPDGSSRIIESRVSVLEEEGERIVLAVARDITERYEMEEELRRLALRDPLTGVANRAVLCDNLRRAVAFARRHGRPGAVLLMDLDDFKGINDTLGHAVGDALLEALAERVQAVVRDSDLVARLGGDEFAILLHALEGADPRETASRILAEVERPLRIGSHELRPRASIGIALLPRHGDSPDALLRAADLALYEAKRRRGEGLRVVTFSRDLAREVEKEHRIAAELRRHIAEERIEVHYQPVFELRTGRLLGVEALVRWPAEEDGSRVDPELFVRIAEQRGLIGALDRLVLAKALRDMVTLERELGRPLRLAVNISPRELGAEGYGEQLVAMVRDSGFPLDHLELEITERVLLEHCEEVARSLGHLKRTGISLAIDDFGTGYSSLVYLKRFPVRCLKLDRCFVAGLPEDGEDRAIVDAVVGLARAIGITVLAEGIETREQLDYLIRAGCREGQGYFWHPPLPFHRLREVALAGPRRRLPCLAGELAVPAS